MQQRILSRRQSGQVAHDLSNVAYLSSKKELLEVPTFQYQGEKLTPKKVLSSEMMMNAGVGNFIANSAENVQRRHQIDLLRKSSNSQLNYTRGADSAERVPPSNFVQSGH